MSIYTGNGDTGETSGLNGQKVSKNDSLIHFLGSLDELNCQLGMVKALLCGEEKLLMHSHQFLEDIQKNIMKITTHVCKNEITVLEKEIDRLSEHLPEIKNFVIPGANILEAHIHLARVAARNAERLFFSLGEKYSLDSHTGVYLNRLSDYLFTLSRQFAL